MNDPKASADRVIEVFNQAQIQPPGELRREFIAHACGDDESLCAKVTAMLGEHDGSFVNADAAVSPEIEAEFARLKPEEVGERDRSLHASRADR